MTDLNRHELIALINIYTKYLHRVCYYAEQTEPVDNTDINSISGLVYQINKLAEQLRGTFTE